MKKVFIISLLAFGGLCAKAQTTNIAITEHDAVTKAKDADIKTSIITPAQQGASGVPDWKEIAETITKKYDATTADRTVTKAKIFYYYYKDWPAFCDALVSYTDKYELANDYPLLNKNAVMVLKNSNDAAQLKAALRWAKLAMNGDVANADYKGTWQQLTDKLAGK